MRRHARDSKTSAAITMAVAKSVAEGCKQSAIARDLKISQADVSRRKRQALKLKWLVAKKMEFAGPRVAPAEWRAAETAYFSGEKTLKKLLTDHPAARGRLQRVTQVNMVGDLVPHESIVHVMRELLKAAETIGVTWGYTVRSLIEVLEQHLDEALRRRPIHVVPLCGEPLRERADPSRFSSSALAMKLAQVINRTEGDPRAESIAGVPAFIPARFKDESAVRLIRQFICEVAGYRKVFGDGAGGGRKSECLVDKLGAIVTGVGHVSQDPIGIFLKERIEDGEISRSEAQHFLAGDIGGVLIEKASATAAEKRRIEEMNRRWLGISRDQIAHCAEQAVENGTPGVIVLALDVHRLDIVRRCIELGLVNELVVSSSLAQRLER